MTDKATVEEFIAQRKLAVVGVSKNPQKFGTMVFKELKAKGYQVFPINPSMETFEGQPCFPNLASLPEKVGGAVIIVSPAQTEQVVRDAKAAGIPRVWMQQGAESPTAIEYCQKNGLKEVHGECIMMFAQPVGSVHKFHRLVWGLFGKLPK